MSLSFLPDVIIESITDLTPEFLHAKGIELLMLDFDNTIVPYTTSEPTERMSDWLKEMAQSDIIICVVSNSNNDRVKVFCDKYGISCITGAKKPFSKGISECLNRFGIARERAAIAGDQIYTDTLGGNCSGVYTILVKAIHNHNFWLKLRHVAELPFIYFARKRRISNEKH